jgi:ectoine hydroxylase-related dioxygenase (phytanoyl-CoA dioxygenase family)
MLTDTQLSRFHERGSLMVPALFTSAEMDEAIADVIAWGEEFLRELKPAQRAWYVEGQGDEAQLRKLDNPVFHRPMFRAFASQPELVSSVEQLIGAGVTAFFSQVFFKSPEIGGPKPIHQDNFYFGPSDENALVTAWIALDEATTENGCLYYGPGSHRAGLVDHFAPDGEPFNLQAPASVVDQFPLSPAPVPKGGVSFHHGNILHQSSGNRSLKWRRAVAVHYLQNDASLVRPTWDFDESVHVRIS